MSKRYKYGLFIIMIIVLNTTNTESHDEFMKYVNCVYQDVINPSNCGHVIRWENWENIPIETRFSFDFPLDLNGSQAEIEFPDLLDNWPGVSFEQKSSGNDNIVVRFTTDASYFSGLHVYGRAIHCIKNGFIVAYDDSPDCTQSNSWVLLNNSANITFQWTQNPYQVGTWVNFNGVIVHEIGHVLGLGHCTDAYAVMYPDPASRDFVVLDPNESDITGINYLTSCETNPCSPPMQNEVNITAEKKLNYLPVEQKGEQENEKKQSTIKESCSLSISYYIY